MKQKTGILSAIGDTPLIKLERLIDDSDFNVFGKLEFLNPAGSIKDRPAKKMLTAALEKGAIDKNTTIVESSSGNLAIGLAQACAYLNLRLVCVMDVHSTDVNRRIVEAYGGTVVLVKEPDPITGGFLQARVEKVKELLNNIPGSFNCNQYANTDNPSAHYQTMDEIARKLNNRVDYLFCATSTCGSLRGCSEYILKNNLKTKIVAVDAEGSVIFDDQAKRRLIPGHGASRLPELFHPNLTDTFQLVSDLDCIIGCRRLLNREAIFAGGSSGGIVSAILNFRKQIPAGSNCVAMICDRGERYLNTIYSDHWVNENFGDEHFKNITHLWNPTAVTQYQSNLQPT